MNIGVLSSVLPYLPARDGFRVYAGNVVKALARRHRVDLISPVDDDEGSAVQWARDHCASVTVVPTPRPGISRRALNLASAHLWGEPLHLRSAVGSLLRDATTVRRWDVLHVEGSFAAGLVPRDLPVARVLSVHDSGTLRCEEMLRCSTSIRERLYYLMLRYHEPRYQRLVYPRFERCVAVAPRDAEAVRQTVPGIQVAVIPSGIDTEYFRPLDTPREPTTVTFHGNLGYAPNVEAAVTFADEIFPRVGREVPRAIFHLVGAAPAPTLLTLAKRPGIRLSANLADVRTAVGSASVYVCAMRSGTGVKTKILEAMALGVPIVCYPAGAAGIDATPGKDLYVADNAEMFAQRVVELLRTPELAHTMATSARALVETKYGWESRAKMFEDLYAEATALRGSSHASRERRSTAEATKGVPVAGRKAEGGRV